MWAVDKLNHKGSVEARSRVPLVVVRPGGVAAFGPVLMCYYVECKEPQTVKQTMAATQRSNSGRTFGGAFHKCAQTKCDKFTKQFVSEFEVSDDASGDVCVHRKKLM